LIRRIIFASFDGEATVALLHKSTKISQNESRCQDQGRFANKLYSLTRPNAQRKFTFQVIEYL
jgi:hypothetical protein